MSAFSYGVFKDSEGYFFRAEDGAETRCADYFAARAMVAADEQNWTNSSRREFNSFEA